VKTSILQMFSDWVSAIKYCDGNKIRRSGAFWSVEYIYECDWESAKILHDLRIKKINEGIGQDRLESAP